MFIKRCPGCDKPFQKNRSYKRHILGHTYTTTYNKRDEKGKLIRPIVRETKEVVIVPCPHIEDAARDFEAYRYTLDEHRKDEELDTAA